MKGWLIILSLFPISVAQTAEVVQLSPGRQHVISAPNVRRAAIGDAKIADVKALPANGQVIVTGISAGSTDLILWSRSGGKKSYVIQVTGQGKSVAQEVRALIGDMEGIVIKQTGGRVVIDGQIFRSEDLERLRKVITLYPHVVNLTRVNNAALEYFSRQVYAVLKRSGLGTVSVAPAGDTLFLEGEVARKEDSERAERIAASVYAKITNRLTVGVAHESLVLVDVKLMEVRRNSLRQVGINWPGEVSGTGSLNISGGDVTTTATVVTDRALSLRALVEKGLARILANPKLLCRSGSPASFLAGGEIPIRLVAERTAKVFFKQYGLRLDVQAREDRSANVFLEIEAKISDLDKATAIEGIPGILEHNVKTAVDLKIGETVVLGGLIDNRASKNVSKVPFLGHIPILGELFKSREFQNNQSEFLVFLTPKPGGPGTLAPEIELQRSKDTLHKVGEEMELSILD
jgi:pilus assembly protein CpaC